MATLTTSRLVEDFCDKWGWVPEPAMLLDLGKRIDQALRNERERCAKIARTHNDNHDDAYHNCGLAIAEEIEIK